MTLADRALRAALVFVLAFALAMRTLDAQANWRDPVTLWQRAVSVNPAMATHGACTPRRSTTSASPSRRSRRCCAGCISTSSPRLVMREALIILEHGDRAKGEHLMRTAAEAGEPRAMTNLALLELADGQTRTMR